MPSCCCRLAPAETAPSTTEPPVKAAPEASAKAAAEATTVTPAETTVAEAAEVLEAMAAVTIEAESAEAIAVMAVAVADILDEAGLNGVGTHASRGEGRCRSGAGDGDTGGEADGCDKP